MMIIVTPTGTTSSTRMSTGALTKGHLRGGLPRHCVQPVEIIGGTLWDSPGLVSDYELSGGRGSAGQQLHRSGNDTCGAGNFWRPAPGELWVRSPSPAHLSSTHGFPERQVCPVQLVQVLNPQTLNPQTP
jgi:hypothetical protein